MPLVQHTPLTLASTSKWRKQVLENLGLTIQTAAPHVDEEQLKPQFQHLSPKDMALELARAKGESVPTPNGLILSGDQICALGAIVYDKPLTTEKQKENLAELAGKTHTLFTAICLFEDGSCIYEKVAQTHLTLRPLTASQIEAFVHLEDATSCAGGYVFEGFGIHLFEKIEGDVTAIEGIPKLDLLHFLYNHNVLELAP